LEFGSKAMMLPLAYEKGERCTWARLRRDKEQDTDKHNKISGGIHLASVTYLAARLEAVKTSWIAQALKSPDNIFPEKKEIRRAGRKSSYKKVQYAESLTENGELQIEAASVMEV
jgi:hypothetical protein